MKLYPIILAITLNACVTPPKVYYFKHPRVKRVMIASNGQVYHACYRPGGLTDHGVPYPHDVNFAGCYMPDTGDIWVNRDCKIDEVLRHEFCHAVSGLPDDVCDDNNHSHCNFGYSRRL